MSVVEKSTTLECMLCYHELEDFDPDDNYFVKICNYEHYFCFHCIVKLEGTPNERKCPMCLTEFKWGDIRLVEDYLIISKEQVIENYNKVINGIDFIGGFDGEIITDYEIEAEYYYEIKGTRKIEINKGVVFSKQFIKMLGWFTGTRLSLL